MFSRPSSVSIKYKPGERVWPPRPLKGFKTHFEYRCLTCNHVWKGQRDLASADHSSIHIPRVCPQCHSSLRNKYGKRVEISDLIHDLPTFIPGTTIPYKTPKDEELLADVIKKKPPPTAKEMELFEPSDDGEYSREEKVEGKTVRGEEDPKRGRGRPRKSSKKADNVRDIIYMLI